MGCREGCTEIVEILLGHQQLNVNKKDTLGSTPLFESCRENHIDIVQILVKDARVAIEETNEDGWSPYMRACFEGNADIIKVLLSCGREIGINRKSTEKVFSSQSRFNWIGHSEAI